MSPAYCTWRAHPSGTAWKADTDPPGQAVRWNTLARADHSAEHAHPRAGHLGSYPRACPCTCMLASAKLSKHVLGRSSDDPHVQPMRRLPRKIQGLTPVGYYCELIPKTLFHVTEMRFSKNIIPKQFFHVLLWITNEYMICNFREINSRNIFLETEM